MAEHDHGTEAWFLRGVCPGCWPEKRATPKAPRGQADDVADRRAYLAAALEYGVSPLVPREDPQPFHETNDEPRRAEQ